MTEETKISVKVEADIASFKKTLKEAASAAKGLGGTQGKVQKLGLSHQKDLEKVTKKFNKQQAGASKDALKIEKKINAAIKDNIKAIKAKEKAYQSSLSAIQREIDAVKKLEKHYKDAQRAGGGGRGRGDGRGRGGPGGRRGGGVGGALLGVGATVGVGLIGLASLLKSLVTSQITSGYASYVSYGRQAAALTGMPGARASGFVKNPDGTYSLGAGVRKSERLGFSATETVGAMRSIGRQTGNVRAAYAAQRLARTYGGDVEEVGGFMGTLTRAGQGFGGKMGTGGQRQLVKIMEHAFTSGLDRSRAGEHLSSVAQAVGVAQQYTTRKVDAAEISALLGAFSRSGQPGLQGAAGLSNLGKIDARVRQAGMSMSDDPGTALIYQALGFGGPGGGTGLYEVKKQLQRGIFGEGGAGTLTKIMSRMGIAGGGQGSQLTNMLLSEQFGLSLDTIEGIQKAMADLGGDPEALSRKVAELTDKDRPFQERLFDLNKEQLEVAKRAAELDNRSIGIGKSSAESLERIQDVINKMVIDLLPFAIDVLETIAEIMEAIYEGLKGLFPNAFTGTVEKVGGSVSSVNKGINTVMGDFTAGKISGAEAGARLSKLTAALEEGNADLMNLGGPEATAMAISGSTARVAQLLNLRKTQGILTGSSEAARLGITDPTMQRNLSFYYQGMERKAFLERLGPSVRDTMGEDYYNTELQSAEHMAARAAELIGSEILSKLSRHWSQHGTTEPGEHRATGSQPADTTVRRNTRHN